MMSNEGLADEQTDDNATNQIRPKYHSHVNYANRKN